LLIFDVSNVSLTVMDFVFVVCSLSLCPFFHENNLHWYLQSILIMTAVTYVLLLLSVVI